MKTVKGVHDAPMKMEACIQPFHTSKSVNFVTCDRLENKSRVHGLFAKEGNRLVRYTSLSFVYFPVGMLEAHVSRQAALKHVREVFERFQAQGASVGLRRACSCSTQLKLLYTCTRQKTRWNPRTPECTHALENKRPNIV